MQEQIVTPNGSEHEQRQAAGSIDVRSIRIRNRAARRRETVVDNVIERLEYFGALPPDQREDLAVRRSHAQRIVAAVLALSGLEVNQ